MMDRQDIQKLLGGYATGTLTPEEQQALFEAALTDQELFDALAREQSLRDLLHDPAARAQLLASIDDKPLPWYSRFWRPMAIVATAAAGLLAVGVYVAREKPKPTAQPTLIALMKQAPSPRAEVPPPPPPPAPAVVRKPKVVAATKEPVLPAAPAPPEIALKKSEEVAASAASLAPVAAPPRDDRMVTGAAPGRLQSAFLDSGSKPIPLQSAQALFYAQPSQDVTVMAEQSAVMQQQPQQPQQQQKQAAPSQADNKDLARSLKALATLGVAGRVAQLGVKWTILRKREGDEFVEVAPDQLRAGDAVKLRLIPNADGFLSVWEGAAPLVTGTKVERLREFETPVISSTEASQRILTVQFTRTAPQPGAIRNAVEQQSATDSREHATYVLNANASPAAPISVNIPLLFK